MRKILFFFLPVFLFSLAASAQSPYVDSLLQVLKTSKEDTNKVNTLGELAWETAGTDVNRSLDYAMQGNILGQKLKFWHGSAFCLAVAGNVYRDRSDYSQALNYYQASLENYKKGKSDRGTCWAMDNIGLVYSTIGDYDKALSYCSQILEIRKKQNLPDEIATSYNRVGDIYLEKGDYANAVNYFLKAIPFFEKAKDGDGVASSNLNTGIVYHKQRSDSLAMKYFRAAYAGFQKTGNQGAMASTIVNIGNVYYEGGDTAATLKAYNSALKIYQQVKNRRREALCYMNIGEVKMAQKDFAEAEQDIQHGLSIFREIGDHGSICSGLISLGQLNLARNRLDEAEKNCLEGLAIAKEEGIKEDEQDAYKFLALIAGQKGDFKSAYHYHQQYADVRDSIFDENSSQQLHEMDAKYQAEKKDNQIRMLNDSTNLQKAVISDQQARAGRNAVIRNAFIVGFGLVAILAFFIFRSYSEKKKANIIITKQKEEVEEQKHIIEEKNKDILDSINYAKRLQEAILPPKESLLKTLPGSFLLYKPKDIVAGDFYFMEISGDKIILAAADCTGHGVPGAMVSVVCSNALTRTVKEFGLTDPGKILDKVRLLVLETFEKSVSEVNDGMDISLAVIDKKNKTISWAGANNPLWYISGHEIKEITADKQPVGKFDGARSFTTHSFNFADAKMIFLFTDGFADQFGGPNGKKFKYKPFKELLLANSVLPAGEQEQLLDASFEAWRGSLEQVDDVCVLGVAIG
jgi:tetratricopeptide (TPR) repeat protein